MGSVRHICQTTKESRTKPTTEWKYSATYREQVQHTDCPTVCVPMSMRFTKVVLRWVGEVSSGEIPSGVFVARLVMQILEVDDRQTLCFRVEHYVLRAKVTVYIARRRHGHQTLVTNPTGVRDASHQVAR